MSSTGASTPGPRLAIVGVAGRYGRWLHGFFSAHRQLAAQIRGHDPADPASDPAEVLAHWADVVVFSTPVAETAALIRRFSRLAPQEARRQLWIDVTSVKAAPLAAMMDAGAEVLGLHPMCAPPDRGDLAGQRLVVCEGRLAHWRPWVEALLAATRARCIHLEAAEHDRRVALVQGLGHAAHLAQLTVLARSGVPIADLDPCATPTFALDTAMGMRLLAGDPSLYAGLLALTGDARSAITALRDACDELLAEAGSAHSVDALATHIRALQEWAGAERIDAGDRAYRRAVEAALGAED